MPEAATIFLRDLLTEATVRVGLPGRDKSEVLDHLVTLVAGHPNVLDVGGLRRAVLDREEMMSTGVGEGLALPHAKTDAVDGLVAAFAITESPIEFDAIDGKPVHRLFLLAGPPGDHTRHIRVLSRISRLMAHPEFRDRLNGAASAEEVLAVFEEARERFREH